MNREEFGKLQESLFESVRELSRTKGNDYAGNSDALGNFKHHARLYDVSPELIWGIYAGKHWDAVTTYIRDGGVKSEPIEGRIHDLLVYLTLLYGLVQERKQQDNIKRLENSKAQMNAPHGYYNTEGI